MRKRRFLSAPSASHASLREEVTQVPRTVLRASPRFESLAFQIEVPTGQRPLPAARALVRRALGAGAWMVRPLDLAAAEFEAMPRAGRRRSTPGAWNAAYRLRAESAVVYAEPLFEVPNHQQFPRPRSGGRARSSGGNDRDPGTETNYQWSLETLRVPQAWALFDSRAPGAGIVVGHPDTGYTPHPEIIGPRLRISDGYDFENYRRDPRDPLAGGLLRHPGHGTSTSSLIISAAGLPPDSEGPAFVSGTGAVVLGNRPRGDTVTVLSLACVRRFLRTPGLHRVLLQIVPTMPVGSGR